jgi:hypothetical protein
MSFPHSRQISGLTGSVIDQNLIGIGDWGGAGRKIPLNTDWSDDQAVANTTAGSRFGYRATLLDELDP